MYQLDQTLPSWTAALDPVDLFWNDDSSVSEPGHHEAATAVRFDVPKASERPLEICNGWPDSVQARHSVQAQTGSAAQIDHTWDPTPSAPNDFRDEVLNLLGATERAGPEPAKQEYTQSAPSTSGFTTSSKEDKEFKECSQQRNMSALSRTRSQPNTSEQKQANARESQKRFRMRQKVF